jgi:hypothetical protein
VTISSSRERTGRGPQAVEPGPPGPVQPRRAARAVQLAAAATGVAALAVYLYVALSRLGYPFALEWLEGNSLVEVRRILCGQQVYTAPGVGYVPDGYPPLYFAIAAVTARMLGPYLALRLVSLVSSLACFALLAALVRRETGSLAAGTGAAGLFAATSARRMRGPWGAVAAGVLLASVAPTKQTGLAEGIAVVAAELAGPRRRLAVVAALAEVAVLAVTVLVLGLASGGWYVYYVFELMGQHSLTGSSFGWFWTALAATLGLAAVAAALGTRRVPRELLAGCAALAVEGYAALVHSGGGINDMLPAYLAVALLAGLALGRAGTGTGATRWSRWAAVVSGLLIVA